MAKPQNQGQWREVGEWFNALMGRTKTAMTRQLRQVIDPLAISKNTFTKAIYSTDALCTDTCNILFALRHTATVTLTGEVSAVAVSVPMSAAAAGAVSGGRQVPGERGGEGADGQERLREERVAVEEAPQREPARKEESV